MTGMLGPTSLCGWFHTWTGGPGCTRSRRANYGEQASKQYSSKASASAPSYSLRPWVAALTFMDDVLTSCKMKETFSSSSCFWLWCFIPAIKTEMLLDAIVCKIKISGQVWLPPLGRCLGDFQNNTGHCLVLGCPTWFLGQNPIVKWHTLVKDQINILES